MVRQKCPDLDAGDKVMKVQNKNFALLNLVPGALLTTGTFLLDHPAEGCKLESKWNQIVYSSLDKTSTIYSGTA
jgi:hypothetical protein